MANLSDLVGFALTVAITYSNSQRKTHQVGTRLIVCCLKVLPLRPFTFFVYCRMRSLTLGLLVGRSEKKKSQKKREVELGGLIPQHNNMRSLTWLNSRRG